MRRFSPGGYAANPFGWGRGEGRSGERGNYRESLPDRARAGLLRGALPGARTGARDQGGGL
jgi:hypothetical protein